MIVIEKINFNLLLNKLVQKTQRKMGIKERKKVALSCAKSEITEEIMSNETIIYFVELLLKYLKAINEQNIGVSLTT